VAAPRHQRGGPYPAGSRSRLIVELSVATHLPFTELVELDDAVLATYLDVLRDLAEEMKHGR
jgi:hypothetical protein